MYIPVWLLVLVVAPWLLYLAVGLVTLLGMHALLGVARLVEGSNHGLARLIAPSKGLGPWFDYVAATGVLAALVGLAALLT